MDKNLKCIICGCFISVVGINNLYCFTEKYCKDCKEKTEEQKHIIENIILTDVR